MNPFDYYYFNILWDCPDGGSSNLGPGSGVHCGPPVRVDRGSNAILVHPITAVNPFEYLIIRIEKCR